VMQKSVSLRKKKVQLVGATPPILLCDTAIHSSSPVHPLSSSSVVCNLNIVFLLS